MLFIVLGNLVDGFLRLRKHFLVAVDDRGRID